MVVSASASRVRTPPFRSTAPVCVPAELPVTLPVTAPVKAPTNDVAVNAPVEELKVRLVPLLGGKLPVAAVANSGKHVVSLDSSATVTLVDVVAVVAVVAVSALPVTAPVKAPTNDVAVSAPDEELKVG